MKKRFLSVLLALVMALSLIPAGLAASEDTYDYQPSPDFGTYLGMRDDGVFEFEITIPVRVHNGYYPLVLGHYYGTQTSSDTSVVGFYANHLYGIKPGTATLEYKVYSELGQAAHVKAIAYVTVVPKEEFDPSVNVGFANVQPPEPASVTPEPITAPEPTATPEPVPTSTPDPVPTNTPDPIPTSTPEPTTTTPGAVTNPGSTPSGIVAGMDVQKIYQAMIALKEQYPDGTRWTNDNYYGWHGGIYIGGYGCAGFAFMLSDAAFGNLPARKLTSVSISDVRVGDILRINSDTHSVIVLEVHDDHVVTAEGNINGAVRWGRTLTAATVKAATYLITRYPDGSQTPDPTQTSTPETTPAPTATPNPAPAQAPVSSFSDVPAGQWYANAVNWAVDNSITNGTGNGMFSPTQVCTQEQILTFLYRATRGDNSAATAGDMAAAVNWARESGIIDASFNGKAACTRATAVSYIWQAMGKFSAGSSSFSDVAAGASYAAAVDWAVEVGVTDGTGNGQFSPNRICDRGTIVTFLHRAYVPSARLTANS